MKENFEVLARKYRPSNFDELIGQETISQTLSLALDSNRLSHAYLFSGLRGSGKTSTARIFAKALICEQGVSHQPCGVCNNCKLALENRHIDIIEMDAASSRKIDDIRDLVEQTKYKPTSARFKIFIIDEVHMLTKEAFNALLKTLEEPPEYVKFILATTDPLKLPATILSRTQHFRFKSIQQNKVINHLSHILNLEGIQFENEALEMLARSGSGSLRDTLTLLDQAIIYSKNQIDVNTVSDMLGLVDPKFIDDIFKSIFAKDYVALVKHTQTLQEYEGEMVVDEFIAYLKDKMYKQDNLFSTLILDRFFRILSDSKYLFSINADSSFVLSLVLFKMVEALRIKEVDQMIESLQKEINRPDITIKQDIQSTQLQSEQTIQEEINQPTQQPHLEEQVELPIKEPTQEVQTQEQVPQKQAPQEEPPQIDPEVQKQQELQAQKEKEQLTAKNNFAKLIEMIKDRNAELGECFERSVFFVSYEDNKLTWESCADEECKKVLKYAYGVIKQFVREIFGFETAIKGLPCSKEIQNKPKDEEIKPHVESVENTPMPQQTPQNTQPIQEQNPQPQMQYQQSDSMIEQAEMGDASCVSDFTQNDNTKVINATEIQNEPMVQKAVEMFEVTKQTIQSKV